jgi:hypothetical protein
MSRSCTEPENDDQAEPKKVRSRTEHGPDDYYPTYDLHDLRPLYTEIH